MAKVYKLSMEGLKKIIAEEKKILSEADLGPISDAPKKPDREVEADEYADTLEDPVNWMRAAKIKEARLLKTLKRLREGMRRRQAQINEARSKKQSRK